PGPRDAGRRHRLSHPERHRRHCDRLARGLSAPPFVGDPLSSTPLGYPRCGARPDTGTAACGHDLPRCGRGNRPTRARKQARRCGCRLASRSRRDGGGFDLCRLVSRVPAARTARGRRHRSSTLTERTLTSPLEPRAGQSATAHSLADSPADLPADLPADPPADLPADSLAQARALIKDLFEARAGRYWTDFLLSLAIAYGAVALYLSRPPFSPVFIASFVVAAFALFRCGVFMHELVHLPARRLRVFRAAWNVLFGIPALTPSFMYKCHADHHNPRHFGTSRDGEYLPLGAGPVRRILFYLIVIPVLPALALFRFLVMTPVSLLHPRLRRAVLERASSYVINPTYRRTLPAEERHWLR